MATPSGITGVLGQSWRADVTTWGAVVPWDGSSALDWHVAADDRWHTPADEAAVRHVRVGGTPVFETRLGVPGGDAVHRVWSIADGGGATAVEVRNDSPLPIAVAFTRRDLRTSRPIAEVPIRGIDLPADSTTVLPIGHRTAVSVALTHDGSGPGPLPARLPDAAAVARGWRAAAERAGRVALPDEQLADALVAARCDLLLGGPPTVEDDPVAFLLALAELMRLGALDGSAAAARGEEIAAAVGAVAMRPGWVVDAALDAAAAVLARTGERRAGADVARIVARRPDSGPPGGLLVASDGIRSVAAVERRMARRGRLLPDGLPAAWRGVDFEVHGLAVGPETRVSFAVRWHGAHPAVLWELSGAPIELSAPSVDPAWRTMDPVGEALWRLDRPSPGRRSRMLPPDQGQD